MNSNHLNFKVGIRLWSRVQTLECLLESVYPNLEFALILKLKGVTLSPVITF